MAHKIGERFSPLPTEVNSKLKISPASLTTICYIDQFYVSVYIDNVPGFYFIKAKMPLSVFAANFKQVNEPINTSYSISRHFEKEYPIYFSKVLGV